MAHITPTVVLVEHAQLGRAIDVVSDHFRRYACFFCGIAGELVPPVVRELVERLHSDLSELVELHRVVAKHMPAAPPPNDDRLGVTREVAQ